MKNGIVWWKMVVGLQLDTSSVTLGNCLKNNKLSDHSWQSCHGAQHHRVSVIHLILIQVIKVSCMFSLWELIMWSFSLLRPLVKLVKPTITYFVTLLVCYEPDQGDYMLYSLNVIIIIFWFVIIVCLSYCHSLCHIKCQTEKKFLNMSTRKENRNFQDIQKLLVKPSIFYIEFYKISSFYNVIVNFPLHWILPFHSKHFHCIWI